MPLVRIPFRIVDVFTDRPLSGNQLCVIPDPVELSVEAMQSIAREIGFSETTFVTLAGGDRYAMRIFTPGAELPFAGHPSLGTAFVLVSEGRVTSPATQVVAVGELPMSVDLAAGTARMRQFPPRFGREVSDRGQLASAVGLSPGDLHAELPAQVVSTGIDVLMVPARDGAAVARARPNPSLLATFLESVGTDGLYLFSANTGSSAKARFFAAGIGIDEDAATGSAAGPCGAYLAERGILPPGRLTITQGVEIGRPSTLLVDVDRLEDGTWEVHVGGGVAKVAEGEFDLPL
jgi:trans-2,3-dihydro-3-hydroxyanthranilate isomerase